MNPVIASITYRTVLGRRRALLLVALPLVLIAIAVVIRLVGDVQTAAAAHMLQTFGLGTLLPLLGLIAGTGVIGSEIDDGAIVYLLTKPIPRGVIAMTKLVVAITVATAFAAIPMLIACAILVGNTDDLTAGFTIGTVVGAIAYCAVFVALAVISRHAVIIGLLYALLWETVVGGLVSGAQTLSIHQWAYSVTDALTSGGGVHAPVRLTVAVPLLVVVSIAGAWLAASRLRSLRISGEE